MTEADAIRANIFRILNDVLSEGITVEQTYNTRSFPAEVRREIVLRDHFTCTYCNRVGTIDKDPDGELWTVDHVIPWSRGGVTAFDNATLCCRRCNCEKKDKTPAEYIRWLRFEVTPNDDLPEGDLDIDETKDDIQGKATRGYVEFELTGAIRQKYTGGSWDDFAREVFNEAPNIPQAQLRKIMAEVDHYDREPSAFSGEAFRLYHLYSPNGRLERPATEPKRNE